MSLESALAALDSARHGRSLEEIRRIVETFERQSGGADDWETSRLLRHACDVIRSHDFGDLQGQAELIRTYASRALLRSQFAGLEQELRLLAHLQQLDNSGNDWPSERLARSRRWLRALKSLTEAVQDAGADTLPHLKTAPPQENLPAGIAPEQVEEEAPRHAYRSARDRNREDAEAFAVRWKLKQLLSTYEPMATNYVLNAYGRKPYVLSELKQLLDEYLTGGQENANQLSPLQSGSLAVVPTEAANRRKSARRPGSKRHPSR
jgi:hypothetical protein